MPVFVDEIVISVEVTNQEAAAPPSGGSGAATGERQAMVAECVERVLDILRQKQER